MGRDGEFAARGRAREVEEEMMAGTMIRLAVGRKMGLGWEGVGQDLFDFCFSTAAKRFLFVYHQCALEAILTKRQQKSSRQGGWERERKVQESVRMV